MDYDLVIVAGTRPEYLKLVSVFSELKKTDLNWCFVNTGQHKDLLTQVQNEKWPQINFIRQENDLALSIAEVIKNLGDQFNEFLKNNTIKKILVQGDTLSAYAGALWAFTNRIPVIHLEAGMRTHDLKDPFPEEGFRRAISTMTSMHLCANELAKKNLINEGFCRDEIEVVGNTLKDLFFEKAPTSVSRKKEVLVTIHRQRNDDDVVFELGKKIKDWALANGFKVLWVNHPNKRLASWSTLNSKSFIELSPMSHADLKQMLFRVSKVVTDSGGLQEEARWSGCPVSILRDVTEWNEGVELGESVLVGALGGDLIDDLSNKNRTPWDSVSDSNLVAKNVVEMILKF